MKLRRSAKYLTQPCDQAVAKAAKGSQDALKSQQACRLGYTCRTEKRAGKALKASKPNQVHRISQDFTRMTVVIIRIIGIMGIIGIRIQNSMIDN